MAEEDPEWVLEELEARGSPLPLKQDLVLKHTQDVQFLLLERQPILLLTILALCQLLECLRHFHQIMGPPLVISLHQTLPFHLVDEVLSRKR